VLNQLDADLELIISIDQSSDRSESLVREFKDSRLKIFIQNHRLGMTDNYRFLISKARGEWLTIIGQDDALVPFATSMLRTIIGTFPQHELVTSRRSYAFWPDTLKHFGKYSFIYPIDTRRPRLISSHKFLMQSLSGYREYSEGPQLYTGTFVKRVLIDRITQINGGNFYNYLIPDVCSAANFLTNSSEFVYSPLPLFIVGSSSISTGIAIDQSLSKSPDQSSNLSINTFFTNSSNEINTPGDGLFTSFSWYLYEAYTKTVHFRKDIESKDSIKQISHLALASLKFESKRSNLFKQAQQSRFLQLSRQFGMRKIEIGIRQLFIRLVLLQRKSFKYLMALRLFLSRKLILSTSNDQQIFSLNDYCTMLISNGQLQKFLMDFQKENNYDKNH
jgi:glycosyltransferase involved in cell wall biosynthesis